MERGIAEFIRQFEAEGDAILQDATQRVSNALVRESLIDTGAMVADWDVAVGDWPSNTTQPDDPKRSTTRARLKAGFKDIRMGQSVFFENNDPAALEQEYGHLKRQPKGLARLVARKWKRFVVGAGIAAKNRVTGGGKRTLTFD